MSEHTPVDMGSAQSAARMVANMLERDNTPVRVEAAHWLLLSVGQLTAERDSLRAVNAELLEALEAYDAWADKTICTDVDLKKIREQMRAAIASARKQGEQG